MQKLSDFLAAQGKTADDVTVAASSNAPQPVASVANTLGATVAYAAGPTMFAVLLDFNLQDTEIPL